MVCALGVRQHRCWLPIGEHWKSFAQLAEDEHDVTGRSTFADGSPEYWGEPRWQAKNGAILGVGHDRRGMGRTVSAVGLAVLDGPEVVR